MLVRCSYFNFKFAKPEILSYTESSCFLGELSMAKIGVFGGSFNPIHEGHVHFLKQMKIFLNLDKIILVICKSALHKNVNLVDKSHRVLMCNMATEALDFVEVSPLEFEIKKNGYGTQILQKIADQNRNSELFLLVGPDSFIDIGKWYGLEKILKLSKIVTACSGDYERDEIQRIIHKNRIDAMLLSFNLLACHSTMIRIRLAQGLGCDGLLNPDVARYIKRNGLFCDDGLLEVGCENACRNMVSIRRFNHCVLVAKMARTLAKIYGEDEKLAYIAGILHDIVKEKSPEFLLNVLKLGGKNLENLNDVERPNPKLWHGPAGAIYCRNVLGIENKKIFNAIDCHTTAKKNMTAFDKIIYISDNTSADRKSVTAKIERKIAKKSLNGAIIFHLKHYIKLGCDKQILIHPNSIECYNQLVAEENSKISESFVG